MHAGVSAAAHAAPAEHAGVTAAVHAEPAEVSAAVHTEPAVHAGGSAAVQGVEGGYWTEWWGDRGHCAVGLRTVARTP